jgi:hypothetical protein
MREREQQRKKPEDKDVRTDEGIENIKAVTNTDRVKDLIREMGAGKEPLKIDDKTVLKCPVNSNDLKNTVKSRFGLEDKEFSKVIKKLLTIGELMYGYDADKILYYTLT